MTKGQRGLTGEYVSEQTGERGGYVNQHIHQAEMVKSCHMAWSADMQTHSDRITIQLACKHVI